MPQKGVLEKTQPRKKGNFKQFFWQSFDELSASLITKRIIFLHELHEKEFYRGIALRSQRSRRRISIRLLLRRKR